MMCLDTNCVFSFFSHPQKRLTAILINVINMSRIIILKQKNPFLLQRTNSISPKEQRPKSEAAATSVAEAATTNTNGRRASSPIINVEAKKLKKEEVRLLYWLIHHFPNLFVYYLPCLAIMPFHHCVSVSAIQNLHFCPKIEKVQKCQLTKFFVFSLPSVFVKKSSFVWIEFLSNGVIYYWFSHDIKKGGFLLLSFLSLASNVPDY